MFSAVLASAFSAPDIKARDFSCKVTATLGCYSDFTDQKTRALPIQTGADGLTQETCAAACAPFKTSLAAVEFGSQCFCGEKLGPIATKQPDADCAAMKCPGDKSEDCGGSDRMVAFKYECTGSLTPNFHGCLDASATALPYCDEKLSLEARSKDLLGRLSLEEKVAMITPQPKLGGTCATHTAGKAEIGLPVTRLEPCCRIDVHPPCDGCR